MTDELDKPKTGRNILILVVLIAALGFIGIKAFNRIEATTPTGDYDTVILHCADCKVDTEFPATNIAMPVCKQCKKTYGQMPNATLSRELRGKIERAEPGTN